MHYVSVQYRGGQLILKTCTGSSRTKISLHHSQTSVVSRMSSRNDRPSSWPECELNLQFGAQKVIQIGFIQARRALARTNSRSEPPPMAPIRINDKARP